MGKLTFNRTDFFVFQVSRKVSLTILRKLFVGLHRDKKENSIGGKQFTGGLDRDIFTVGSSPMRPLGLDPRN